MPTPRSSAFEDFARYSGLGMQLFASIGLLAWFGWWVDGKLGSSPFGLLSGVFIGFGAGLYSIVKAVPASGSDRERRPPQAGGGSPPSP